MTTNNPAVDDSAHAEALRINERIQRSMDKRESMRDYLPEVGSAGMYEAPHMLQVRHYSTPDSSTVLVVSREQALHLGVQIMLWLINNPDEDVN